MEALGLLDSYLLKQQYAETRFFILHSGPLCVGCGSGCSKVTQSTVFIVFLHLVRRSSSSHNFKFASCMVSLIRLSLAVVARVFLRLSVLLFRICPLELLLLCLR